MYVPYQSYNTEPSTAVPIFRKHTYVDICTDRCSIPIPLFTLYSTQHLKVFSICVDRDPSTYDLD